MPERQALKVLVIDDEEGMRLGIARALRDHHQELPDLGLVLRFEVDGTPDAESGRQRLTELQPDLVLLDHKLPGMNGLDLLRTLDGEGQDFVVIVITAYASIEMAVDSTRHGAYDLLAKPFTPDELKACLARAIRHLVALRKTRQLAEERRRVRFEFLSVLAHELKAPLAAVQSYLEVLGISFADSDPDTFKRAFERVQARLAGMQKLIGDLLDLTRIESGQKVRTVLTVDLIEITRVAMDTMISEADRTGVALSLDAPEALMMEADPGELEIILTNLISNAVKYNRPGGRVEVRLRREQDSVHLAVSDTGIGLSEEEVGRLFREFARIRKPETQWIAGSGLGLSIVDKLVRLYGGRIAVESQEHVGTTFSVHLPAGGP